LQRQRSIAVADGFVSIAERDKTIHQNAQRLKITWRNKMSAKFKRDNRGVPTLAEKEAKKIALKLFGSGKKNSFVGVDGFKYPYYRRGLSTKVYAWDICNIFIYLEKIAASKGVMLSKASSLQKRKQIKNLKLSVAERTPEILSFRIRDEWVKLKNENPKANVIFRFYDNHGGNLRFDVEHRETERERDIRVVLFKQAVVEIKSILAEREKEAKALRAKQEKAVIEERRRKDKAAESERKKRLKLEKKQEALVKKAIEKNLPIKEVIKDLVELSEPWSKIRKLLEENTEENKDVKKKLKKA